MGNPRGVRRDFDALEDRRFEFIRLYERGETPSTIARRLRTVRQTVYRWIQDYRVGGKDGLKKAGRAGRKPRLNQQQLQRLEKLLLQRGPGTPGLRNAAVDLPPRGPPDRTGIWRSLSHEGHGVEDSGAAGLGVRSGPRDMRGNANEKPDISARTGRRRVGRALKKSPDRRPFFAIR